MPKQLTYALAAVLGVGVGLAAWQLTPALRAPVVIASGEAQIGGAFALTDQFGKPRAGPDFAGKYLLVFFGFTMCPDVCPTELAKITAALAELAKSAPDKSASVIPIFITIDPERDTVAAMASYLENFDPRFVGLTGSVAQINAVTAGYKVYARKVPDSEQPGSYTMDHSAFIYLMGPDGKYITHFSSANTATAIARQLDSLVL